MKKVVLTGSEGSVGRVLTGRSLVEGERPQLDAEITRVDAQADKGDSTHPFIQSDLKDRDLIKQLLQSHDIFIHGAWNTQEGVLQPDVVDPNNVEMARRILECAEELGELATAKVVLLSSVNAHVPQYWKERRATGDLISVDEQPQPNRHNKASQPGNGTTRYGESKIAMEEAGKKAAENGAHVVVPRIGGINLRDRASSTYEVHQGIYEDPERGKHFDAAPGGWEDAVRLRHADLVSNIQGVIDSDTQAGTFEHYNLVSDSDERVHKLPTDK